MRSTEATARVSEIAARQWGLLTTAQAQTEGVSRLHLSRLTEAGVLERIDQGIYAMPSSVDELTNLRAAWLVLDPKTMAEDRLKDPVASGVVSHSSAASLYRLGDLLDDTPEITVASRRQSRRGTRLHRSPLEDTEVTLVQGLPTTTPARTLADLLRDGHDPTHVAQIAGEILKREMVPPKVLAEALEPLAHKYGQPDGSALLEYLLDLVGLSAAALTAQVASSQLGRSLIMGGQMHALQHVKQTLAKLTLESTVASSDAYRKIIENLTRELQMPILPQITEPLVGSQVTSVPSLDMKALADVVNSSLEPTLIKLAHQIKELQTRDDTEAQSPGSNQRSEDT